MTLPQPAPSTVPAERSLISAEFGEALLVERGNLRCDALLMQRRVRYLALGAMVLLTVLFSSTVRYALFPLALIVVGYTGVVAGTAWILQHRLSRIASAWFPGLVIAADIVALAGFCYLTSPPLQLHRILLLGFLSMQLGVFYFGRRHGWLAVALTIAAYLIFTLGVPPFISGPRPTVLGVSFDVALFAIISTVLIYSFGSYRERIDSLRMYCKIVEHGETPTLPPVEVARWPDELTLLARSFQAMHIRLAEQVGSDPLTGCMNRRSLEARLRVDLNEARRTGTTVAVAAVDLDHFKQINDSRGHPAGDMVLKQLTRIMKQTARETDAVARTGGDEFVIILPEISWDDALMFAESLRRRVEEYTFGPPGTPMKATTSIGVALVHGSSEASDVATAETVLKRADTALYHAKTAGRNQVCS